MTILPCPFCDCAQVTISWDSVYPIAQCVACGARGSRRINGGGERVMCTGDAYSAWNYRPSGVQEYELEELQRLKDDDEVAHLQYVKDLRAEHEWTVLELKHTIQDLEDKLQTFEGDV